MKKNGKQGSSPERGKTMIFNTQIFKKMLKGAYTGSGLNVAREKGRYIFAGEYWYMTIRGDVFPRKAKAAAIELIGEFPVEGENFVIRAKEEKKMDEFNPKWKELIMSADSPAEDLYYKTKVEMESGMEIWRLWQNEKREVVVLPGLASEIAGIENIDHDNETVPEGPYKIGEESKIGKIMYWTNNACEFFVLAPQFKDDKNKEFLTLVESIRLPAMI